MRADMVPWWANFTQGQFGDNFKGFFREIYFVNLIQRLQLIAN